MSDFIRPDCQHDRADMAPAKGWIFTCGDDFNAAVRLNLLKYADQLLTLKLEDELTKSRERIQTLESDIQDLRMLTKQAFIRCSGCDRLKEVSKECRWCAR